MITKCAFSGCSSRETAPRGHSQLCKEHYYEAKSPLPNSLNIWGKEITDEWFKSETSFRLPSPYEFHKNNDCVPSEIKSLIIKISKKEGDGANPKGVLQTKAIETPPNSGNPQMKPCFFI